MGKRQRTTDAQNTLCPRRYNRGGRRGFQCRFRSGPSRFAVHFDRQSRYGPSGRSESSKVSRCAGRRGGLRAFRGDPGYRRGGSTRCETSTRANRIVPCGAPVEITRVEDGREGYFFSGTDGRLWPERARRPRAGSRPRYRYALCLHWERLFEQLGLEEVRLEAPRPWAQGLALLGARRPVPSTVRRLPAAFDSPLVRRVKVLQGQFDPDRLVGFGLLKRR
jgi:hypothetical protein